MRDVDADAGREMVFGDRYQHELWAAGGSACTAAQAIHELLLRLALVLVWGLGEADAVDTAVLTSVLCRGLVCGASPGASPGLPVLFVWRSAVFTAPSAAVKVSRALAPDFLGAWRSELWRWYKLRMSSFVCNLAGRFTCIQHRANRGNNNAWCAYSGIPSSISLGSDLIMRLRSRGSL